MNMVYLLWRGLHLGLAQPEKTKVFALYEHPIGYSHASMYPCLSEYLAHIFQG